MRLIQYLNEKTFDIDEDVGNIYNSGFAHKIRMIQNGNFQFITNDQMTFYEVDSDNLDSEPCRRAHEKNPITIKCGVYREGSFYQPDINTIFISLHNQALDMLRKYGWASVETMLDSKEFKRFKNEFTPNNIKATIYHELSHWLNESLHNKAISKFLTLRKQNKFPEPDMSFEEIDAQIHAIKQMKRGSKNWDRVTWEDIATMNPSQRLVFVQATGRGKKEYDRYMDRLYKRLKREGLVGKLEKPSYSEMKKIIGNT